MREQMTRRARSLQTTLGREGTVGLVVLLVVVLVSAITAYVYVSPPARKSFSFSVTDAAAIKNGDDVRVAGVSVGTISDVTIGTDSVTATASITDSTFVGNQSSVDVRMLTAVGGYFVTIIPAGDAPLGDAVIPPNRVTVPYSIGDVLQSVPHVTDGVEPGELEQTLDQVADGVQARPTSVDSLIKGLDSVASVMSRQRSQVQRGLDLAVEYSNRFSTDREYIFQLVRKVEILLATYYTYRDGFNETFTRLGDVVAKVAPFAQFYVNHKSQVLSVVNQLRQGVAAARGQLQPVIDKLLEIKRLVEPLVAPDGQVQLDGGTILASDVCVPFPGRKC